MVDSLLTGHASWNNVHPLVVATDAPGLAAELLPLLTGSGFHRVEALDSDAAVRARLATGQEPGTVILDLAISREAGLDLLPELTHNHPQIPVIVLAADAELETAVACMKNGAQDFLALPLNRERFLVSVQRAMELYLLRQEVHTLKNYLLHGDLRNLDAFAALVTASPDMRAIFQYVEAVGSSPEPILITGETGVGKGLLAHAVHAVSHRPGPFVSLNVAGLDDTLFSDTLFGHRKGAFSGADTARDGLVAQAAEGTLFLDEIGDLSLVSQIKLLRLLQEGAYYPLGSDQPRLSSARVVAATNQELRGLMAAGRFRPDLFYRLSAHRVEIPPLRERKEDLPLLLTHFLAEAGQALSKAVPDPPPELLTLLGVYPFPGNVRELRAMVFDAMARHRGGRVLSLEGFRRAVREHAKPGAGAPQPEVVGHHPLVIHGDFPTLDQGEEYLIQEAMRRANDNQGVAAALLGITRQSLNRRLVRKRREEGG